MAPVESPWLTMCNRPPASPAGLNATRARTQNPRCETELYATSRRRSVWA